MPRPPQRDRGGLCRLIENKQQHLRAYAPPPSIHEREDIRAEGSVFIYDDRKGAEADAFVYRCRESAVI